ncbi:MULTISPECIES: DUF29 family protein [unclassified Thermosynechococcus]|uniref:DUF29 family protein n=1 Tax=unclassified Thermosynechococcus TaxID=2622553 RepID=UPI0019E820C4|nr:MULTISPECIES: DUF29 family protein [unclassified Thermosynechococcus]HIK34190.1 DUF29 family protein [Thermosynechococcus sp. M98_K2018_005]HIK48099.1 DUF29 family protein [Thermosynechococcus sp. M55_K2018_012]
MITDARTQIELTIADSPSLRDYPASQLSTSDERARRQAAEPTGLPLSTFAETCLYPLEMVLTQNRLPETDT